MKHLSASTCPYCGAHLFYQRVWWSIFTRRFRLICPTLECGYLHRRLITALVADH